MDINNGIKKNPEIIIILLVLSFYLIFFPPIITDEYGFILYKLAGQQYSEKSIIDYHFLAYVGINECLKFIHDTIPIIHWMALFEISTTLLGWILLLRFLKKNLIKFSDNKWLLLLGLFSISIAYISMFSIVSHTKSSLILCGLSSYALIFETVKFREKVGWFLLFVLGTLIRPEGGVGTIIFISSCHLLYFFNISKLLQRAWPFYIFLIIFVGSIVYIRLTTSDFLIQIEPEVEYNFLQGYYKPLESQKTLADSVKYNAAINGMIFDPKILSPEYLRSLQVMPSVFVFFEKIEFAFFRLLKLYDNYSLLNFISFGLIIMSVFSRNLRLSCMLITVPILVFSIFLLLSISSSMTYRHMTPFLLLQVLVMTYFFAHLCYVQTFLSPLYWSTLLILCYKGLSSQISIDYYNQEMSFKKVESAENMFRYIEKKYQNELIISSLGSQWPIFNYRFSIVNKSDFNNTYRIYDCYNFSMQNSYRAFILNETKGMGESPNKYLEWLADNNAIYIDNEERVKTLLNYVNTIYSTNFKFEKEFELVKSKNPQESINSYRVKMD